MNQENKRLAKNTFFLYFRMFFAMIIALYTSRIVLNTLGVIDYGVYNVVGGFVGMFSFLTQSLSSSMQRYYNYEGSAKGNYSQILSCGFAIHIVFSVILILILESIGLWYINNILTLPTDRLLSANFLYQTVIFSSSISIITSPYLGIIMAKERIDFVALVGISEVILRLLLVAILPYVPYDKLIVFSIINLSITFFNFIAYLLYCKLKFSDISLHFINRSNLYKKLLVFTTWNMIGTFALMLKGQGVNLILNYYFGPIINASRGIAYQINTSLSNFYYNIVTAFRPQVVNSCANSNYNRTKKLMFLESKICYVLMLFLIIPMILENDFILHLWLGDVVPSYTNIFSKLILIETLIYTFHTPCSQVVQGMGKIKKFQLINTVINIGLLPVSWVFLYLGFNAEIVFIINIIFALFNTIFCIVYTNKIFNFGLINYISNVIFPCILITIISVLSSLYITDYYTSSFNRLFSVILISGLTILFFSYLLLLNNNERHIINLYIKKLYSKI